jgi:FKBP-type peptidyl-prolyl cis-trans isomerase FklB
MKVLTLALSSAVLLAACSSSESKKEDAPATPTAANPPQAPAATSGGSSAATTASGLRYKVLSSGPAGGTSPTINDTVVVHYRGTLVDGTEFDSSYSRGQPATFGVGQVIRGWTEALQMMKPGDKWLIHIPYNLAYGMQGSPPKIPPFADLVFQVELLQVLH